jgi:hypothetical protein
LHPVSVTVARVSSRTAPDTKKRDTLSAQRLGQVMSEFPHSLRHLPV